MAAQRKRPGEFTTTDVPEPRSSRQARNLEQLGGQSHASGAACHLCDGTHCICFAKSLVEKESRSEVQMPGGSYQPPVHSSTEQVASPQPWAVDSVTWNQSWFHSASDQRLSSMQSLIGTRQNDQEDQDQSSNLVAGAYEESPPVSCDPQPRETWATRLNNLPSLQRPWPAANKDATRGALISEECSRGVRYAGGGDAVNSAFHSSQRSDVNLPAWMPEDWMLEESEVDSSPWLIPIFDRQAFRGKARQSFNDDDDESHGGSRLLSAYTPHQNFGALPFSSAIGANYYPVEIQEMQKKSLSTPTWETFPLSSIDSTSDPLAKIFVDLRAELRVGSSAEDVLGRHAYIAALDDEQVFNRAPKLSQLVAKLVKSIKPLERATTLTMWALMWTHWTLLRWMLAPSPDSYSDIPQIVRPTSWQVFAGHSLIIDFVHSPSLREFICQSRGLDMEWATNACVTVACEWAREKTDALCRDGWTFELDLNPICKSFAGQPDNWSFGPSMRKHLPNSDEYFRIRNHDHVMSQEAADMDVVMGASSAGDLVSK